MQKSVTEASARVGSGAARDVVAAGQVENKLLKVLSRRVVMCHNVVRVEPVDGHAMPGV